MDEEANQQPDWIEELERYLSEKSSREPWGDENRPDPGPGPAEQAITKRDGESEYRAVLTLLYFLSLSEEVERAKKKWQIYRDVLEAWVRYGGRKNTVPLIARDLKKSDKRIYRILAELTYIFENFDDLYIEIKGGLVDEDMQAVWHDIMRGETPEVIRRKHRLEKSRADAFYADIREKVSVVLPKWLNR